ATRRARRTRDNLAEDRLGGAANLPRAAAARAGLSAGAWLGATPRAPVARRQARHIDLFLDAGERLLERDGEVVAEVVAAVGSFAAATRAEAAAEKRVEDVRERHVREVDRGSAGADGGMAEKVVAPAALGVGENRVRLTRLFETVVGHGVVGVAVRMRVHRDLAKRQLEVLGRALPPDPEHLVVVALDRQLTSRWGSRTGPPVVAPTSPTRAGPHGPAGDSRDAARTRRCPQDARSTLRGRRLRAAWGQTARRRHGLPAARSCPAPR